MRITPTVVHVVNLWDLLRACGAGPAELDNVRDELHCYAQRAETAFMLRSHSVIVEHRTRQIPQVSKARRVVLMALAEYDSSTLFDVIDDQERD